MSIGKVVTLSLHHVSHDAIRGEHRHYAGRVHKRCFSYMRKIFLSRVSFDKLIKVSMGEVGTLSLLPEEESSVTTQTDVMEELEASTDTTQIEFIDEVCTLSSTLADMALIMVTILTEIFFSRVTFNKLSKVSMGEVGTLSLLPEEESSVTTQTELMEELEERADTTQAEFMEVVYFVKENTNTDSISVASFSLSGSPRLQFQAGILRDIPFPFSIRQEGFVSDKKEKLILFFEIKGLC